MVSRTMSHCAVLCALKVETGIAIGPEELLVPLRSAIPPRPTMQNLPDTLPLSGDNASDLQSLNLG